MFELEQWLSCYQGVRAVKAAILERGLLDQADCVCWTWVAGSVPAILVYGLNRYSGRRKSGAI
jgi:hypothetical protein